MIHGVKILSLSPILYLNLDVYLSKSGACVSLFHHCVSTTEAMQTHVINKCDEYISIYERADW